MLFLIGGEEFQGEVVGVDPKGVLQLCCGLLKAAMNHVMMMSIGMEAYPNTGISGEGQTEHPEAIVVHYHACAER